MAIGSLIAGVVPALSTIGEGTRKKTEGPGSYDIRTGQYYNPSKVESMSVVGGSLNPIKALSSKYYTPQEKWSMIFSGPFGALAAKKKYRERLEAENKLIGDKYQAIGDKISNLPSYEVASEAYEALGSLQESGGKIKGLASEATDIAERRAQGDYAGMDIDRDTAIQQSVSQLEAIKEIGGAGALSAITEAGLDDQGAFRGINRANLEYKTQASSDLTKAMASEAQIGSQAAQMEATGLSGVASEKYKSYESELNKALTDIDFDINTLAAEQLGTMAQAQASAAQQSGATSALSQIGSAWLANRAGKSTSSSYDSNYYGADAPITEGTQLKPSGNYGGYYNY